MRYIQPQILRAENAARAIQHIHLPDTRKPLGDILDYCGTKFTDPAAYEADE